MWQKVDNCTTCLETKGFPLTNIHPPGRCPATSPESVFLELSHSLIMPHVPSSTSLLAGRAVAAVTCSQFLLSGLTPAFDTHQRTSGDSIFPCLTISWEVIHQGALMGNKCLMWSADKGSETCLSPSTDGRVFAWISTGRDPVGILTLCTASSCAPSHNQNYKYRLKERD